MNSRRILIADDDYDLLQALAVRCTSLGLQVDLAQDALAAVKSVLRYPPPDVICLDVNMPSGNGLGLCEMLAADDDTAQIPVIIMTGSTDPEVVRRCHASCAYYVLKCDDLWSRIEPLLHELVGQVANRPAVTLTTSRLC